MENKRSFILILLFLTTFAISCKKDLNIEPVKTELIADTQNSPTEEVEAATTSAGTATRKLILGINGHPLSAEAYIQLGITDQIKMLKKMGMTWYKINVSVNADGSMQNIETFLPLQKLAKSNGINLLPSLSTAGLKFSDTEAQAYAKGKTSGSNFAAKYSQYFTTYHLGNEMEQEIILAGKSGQYTSNYDAKKFKVTAAYLKGMNEGVKAKDPGAITLVDASWLHYAYIQMLISYGVGFNVLSYHWYSDMEGAAAKAPYNIPDITKKLSGLFPTKPIWFTESNFRPKGLSTDEAKQKDFVNQFIAKCKANSKVQALIFYELLDEPGIRSSNENKLGFVKWAKPYTSWTYKAAAQGMLTK